VKENRKLVVVIDDDSVLLKLIERLLRDTSHQLHTFKCNEDGLTFLRDNPVDIVFVDYRMPGDSGIDFYKAMRHAQIQQPRQKYLWSAGNLPVSTLEVAGDLGITVLSKNLLRNKNALRQLLAI